MNISQSKSMIVVFVMLILILITGTHGMGRYVTNQSSIAFNEVLVAQNLLKGAMVQSTSIESYIIKGGGYYLTAYSYSLLVANGIEVSDLHGPNFIELNEFLNRAISNMELARDTYVNLVNKSNSTPYNSDLINKLMNFDYGSFQTGRGLNGEVFGNVQSFLFCGDVRGVYVEMLTRFEAILGYLYDIKATVDGNGLPTNSTMWRLNQKWSETLLFGQYVAEVFFQIAG